MAESEATRTHKCAAASLRTDNVRPHVQMAMGPSAGAT